MNQPTTPNTVEDFLPLPASFITAKRLDGSFCPAYTESQVRAAILADRAQRTAAVSVDSPEFLSLAENFANESACEEFNETVYNDARAALIAHIQALINQAAQKGNAK